MKWNNRLIIILALALLAMVPAATPRAVRRGRRCW